MLAKEALRLECRLNLKVYMQVVMTSTGSPIETIINVVVSFTLASVSSKS